MIAGSKGEGGIRSDRLVVFPRAPDPRRREHARDVDPIAPDPASGGLSPLLAQLLAAQQEMTAVDGFARWHEQQHAVAPAPPQPATGRYRSLLPVAPPGSGQQYAFDVDLDLCTGCKACVTGCHNLNGLDEGEVWRTVGLLHGGTAEAPVRQTVTTSCHHCVEPACMTGCPVKAYEKDPVTGIVRHLDDQCIGCQYCVLMCPYDAPKFSPARGIVRKCDMCSDRLAHDEAPACVQSCPNEAIRIAVVDQAEIIERADAGVFLPGAPAPDVTLPATTYSSKRPYPHNMVAADRYRVDPEHGHLPLLGMLVLSQLAVGAHLFSWPPLAALLGAPATSAASTAGTGAGAPPVLAAAFSLVALLAGLAVGSAHLGRPWLAFRAILGLRTSWLSREVLAFGLFALAQSLYVGSLVLPRQLRSGGDAGWADLQMVLAAAAALIGAGGVFCSVMVYTATRRDCWRGSVTGTRFGATAILLGAATALMLPALAAVAAPAAVDTPAVAGAFRGTALLLAAVAALKLAIDLAVLGGLRDRRHSGTRHAAALMAGPLRNAAMARFVFAAAGGVVLPLVLFASGGAAAAPISATAALTVAVFFLCVAGELGERYLFFAASRLSRMPGGLLT